MNQPKESPLVSIIVRTKDRTKLLKRALQSIFAQTHRPIEVVLVNDGGCDLDIDEIKAILGDVSLNYIKLEKNMGRAHAGNVGIENARGEYIGFLDDDDELLPEHLSCLIPVIQTNSYKIAYSDALFVYKEYNQKNEQYEVIKKEPSFSEDFDYDLLIFENYIPLMCLLFDKGVFLDFNRFDNTFELYEDWDLLIRLGERYPFYHLKKITAYYNQWSIEEQISQRNLDVNFLKKSYIKVLTKHADKITIERIHNYMFQHVKIRQLLKEYDEKTIDSVNRIKFLQSLLKEKDEHIFNLERILLERDELIHAMKSTKGWRLLEKYRRLRNSIFNLNDDRLRERLIFKAIKVLKDQGLRTFISKANKKLLFNKTIKKSLRPIKYEPSKLSYLDAIQRPIKTKISIIIPTKNAGDEFEFTLRRISQQEGIENKEIIIMDSGSKDNTLDLARLYSSNIFEIHPDEFSHSQTRNIAAEKAKGGILVFTVQDALPIGNKWLYKLVSPIEESNISAVSTLQIPRSDADLFASWSYWSHYVQFLNRKNDSIYNNSMYKHFDELDIMIKRAFIGLDNVCLAIRKDVFDSYKFRGEYAEDLELGYRLIKDGHSLLFQTSNAVIHSHNRAPLYYLKRSYLDKISLTNILNLDRKDIPSEKIFEVIHHLYCVIKSALQSLSLQKSPMREPQLILDLLMRELLNRINRFDPSWQYIRGEEQLDEFLSIFKPIYHDNLTKELVQIFINYLQSLREYLRIYPSMDEIKDSFFICIYKILANIAGDYLGSMTQEDIQHLDYVRV